MLNKVSDLHQAPQVQSLRTYSISRVKYGICERIFRACVFQYAVYTVGWIEKILFYLYRSCSQCTPCPTPLDEKRMARSEEIFKKLGAQEHFVIPEDGRAKIHMITMKASDLEKILHDNGARWERVFDEYLIIPPDSPDEDWDKFQKGCLLNKTGWFLAEREIEGEKRQVIVTCENADLVEEDKKICFLHVQTPFVRERHRAGFYLGMKKDCCFYDDRGVRKSQGVASEKGSYLTLEAVYEKFAEVMGCTPDQVWISGSCRGACIAAHLKRKYHGQGINFVSEQSFSSLEKDMINSQSCIPRLFARWNLDALKSRDIPKNLGPEEDYFSTEKKWENLPKQDRGKVVLIEARNDHTLPKDAGERYIQLAQKVNEKVYPIYFTSPPGTNGHNEACLRDENMHREFLKAIFAD